MDHIGQVKRKKNPREKANILSLLTFSYTTKLFYKAFKKDLEEEDIYEVVDICGSKRNGDYVENKWLKLKKKQINSISKLLWNCFGIHYVLLGMLHLTVRLFTTYMEPEALGKVVSFFNRKNTSLTFDDALYYALILIGIKFLNAFYFQNYIILLQHLSIQIRTALCSLIYRKSLRLTPTAMNEISLGNVITIMTKDIMNFERSIWILNDMWIEIIRTSMVCYLIYNKMGMSSLIGIGVLFIITPLQVYVGKVVRDFRTELNKTTDERLQATQETLSAIKIIKMYTWESVFINKVSDKRIKEMKIMMKTFLIKIISVLGGIISSKIGFYVLIISYIYMNELTSADVIFYVMNCFSELRHGIGMMIPMGTGRFAELWASVSRIKRVLAAPELEDVDNKIHEKPRLSCHKATVEIKDKAILKNINVEIKSGLTAVTGPLGCGKSALLKLFMKEYPLSEGEVIAEANFSYSSQDPWLFPSSIKQNILFGEELDERRYQRVVKACALDYDFSLLEKGDETIVADRGLNLSKGQQARVNLARAVYKQSDIYLLDDPLNALDPSVQEAVFQNVVKGFLNGEIIVLVTHNQRHIKTADNVILLREGAVEYQGKQDGVEISKIIENIENPDQQEKEKVEEPEETDERSKLIAKIGQRKVYSEVKKSGKVDMGVYIKYFQFGGGFFAMFAILLLYFCGEFSESYSARLLTNWINLQQNKTNLRMDNTTNSSVYDAINSKAEFTLNLYSGMIVSSAILDILRQYFFINFSRKASVNIHNTMISKLVTAVMSFYDKYFIGNILNRFSQDLSIVDEHLPHTISMFIMVLFSVGGIVILVSTVSSWFLVPSGVLVLVLILLRVVYMPTARSLKRLEAATRSPVVGHLNASMEGVTTIRAYKAQHILEFEFDRHQDLYTSAHYMTFCVRRAFGFAMDFMSAIFLSSIILKLLLFSAYEEAAGDVGLAITKAAGLSRLVQWVLMQWSELENDMTSVERVLEYTEVPQDNYEGKKLTNWPVKGSITYSDVSLMYGNEKVLKNISISIGSKQKIGIVGRTGAGKSSIISTLFRLYNFEGKVYIDGVDTKTLGLDFLRHCISIIPQDPVLFQGTIRMNIDPFSEYTDEEIWQTIDKVKMKENIPSLDLTITDHGSNFSTGQRQLICLARAIIRKNKIVVLDEATANMDPETENLIQTTINENFSDCTVLIIAHRLQAVMECNKILVLERGAVMEYDDPIVLSEKKNSYFYQMLKSHEGFTS